MKKLETISLVAGALALGLDPRGLLRAPIDPINYELHRPHPDARRFDEERIAAAQAKREHKANRRS